MNIACVIPYSESKFRYTNIKDSLQFTNCNILACYLKNKGLNVQVFDFLFNESENFLVEKQRYIAFSPDIVIVITPFCLEDFFFYDRYIHTGDETIIIGCGVGVLDYSMALNRLSYVDYIVPVHDEPVIYKLLLFLSGKGRLPNGVAYRKDNAIHFEKIDFYNIDEVYNCQDILTYISKEDPHMAYIVASKGCWYAKCTFCTVAGGSKYYKTSKWFYRNIDSVIEEIKELYKRGIVRFHFLDTEFVGPGTFGLKRAEYFAKAIIKSNINIQFIIDARVDNISRNLFSLLKQAGLQRVFVGIESGCQNIIDRFNKKQTVSQIGDAIKVLNELKIGYKVGSILAAPDTELHEIKESLIFFKNKKLFKVMGVVGVGSVFHQLHLHAGTWDYKLYEEQLGMRDLLDSEIPVKYLNKEVELFFEYLDQIYEQIKKRYYTIEKQISFDLKKKDVYFKCKNALRVLSLNMLISIIDILQTNKSNINFTCQHYIQTSLLEFDQYWKNQYSKQ